MPYLNETGLSYYNSILQPWIAAQGVKDAPSELFNFQQTSSAGAVTLWPVGGTPLAPVVDYIFTETPPANGQPKAPDNPSTITGVSSGVVRRFGKNCMVLYPSENHFNALHFTKNSDGSIRIYGTVSSPLLEDYISLCGRDASEVGTRVIDLFKVGMEYTASFESTDSTLRLQLFSHTPDGGYSNMSTVIPGGTGSFTLPMDADKYCWFRIHSGTGTFDATCKVQIELGSQATSMELPAVVDSYAISLGNTYYGGSIDLTTGVMTVTHVAVEPDASTVDISSAPAKLPLSYTDTFGRTITSTDGTSLSVGSSGGTVVYEIATPQTVQLSPVSISALAQTDKYTPRLNTVYSDQESVQVGYIKSPIRNEFELQQAVTALGGNI